jgi:large subunit ribosomal protein L10
MAKNKEQKGEILRNLKTKINDSKSIVFAKYDALTVKENEDLRKQLKAEKNEYLVAKKTLIGLALEENNIKGVEAKSLDGKVAIVFGYEDEVSPAKVVDKFRKDHEGKIDFVGGILENKFLSADEVNALAKLPSKEELYAKVVGSLNAPVSGFVNVLAGNMRGFVNVLKAIEEKKA